MHDFSEWNRLDVAAYRVSMKRSVRWFGWVGAGVGALLVVVGLAAPFLPLAAIGLVLLGAGVWNLYRPSITGLLVDGVVMILTGLFNCTLWLWLPGSRESSIVKWAFAGIFQIVWGIRRLGTYLTARGTVNDAAAIARLETIIRELSKGSAKDDPTIVEFWTGGFRKRRNRIGLCAQGVVALLEHQVVRLEKRTDIWIETRGTNLSGRTAKVRIQMSDLELVGQMPVAHFERFERWKLGMSQPRSTAA